MSLAVKFLIGMVATGATAVGGYYGLNALNSSEPKSLDNWKKKNSNWLKGSWKSFSDKIKTIGSSDDLYKQWEQWKGKHLEKNKSYSDLEVSQKFKKWCDGNPTDSGIPKVKEEGCK